MVLSKQQIVKSLKNSEISINPFQSESLSKCSYQFKLGSELLQIISDPIDAMSEQKTVKHEVPKDGLILYPNHLYLGSTIEAIGSKKYIITLTGNEYLAQLGMFIHITADLGHLGTNHRWTLEIRVIKPLKIYPGMNVGHALFWELRGSNSIKYDGRYAKYNEPHVSEMYKEL